MSIKLELEPRIGAVGSEPPFEGFSGGGSSAGFRGSGGPGPGIRMAVGGRLIRVTGTSTCRESEFSAGLSVNAFPAAFRMNVYSHTDSQLIRLRKP